MALEKTVLNEHHMQIILASAKIMNDKLKSVPGISLSTPRFLNEADAFAKGSYGLPLSSTACFVLWMVYFLIGWRAMWNCQAELDRICSVSGRAA